MRIVWYVVFVVAALGFLAILISFQKQQFEPVACTMEAKICPDGSGVGRQGPKCEFEACPTPQACDAGTPCPDDKVCVSVPSPQRYIGEIPSTPFCVMNMQEACRMFCEGECNVLESFPPQIACI